MTAARERWRADLLEYGAAGLRTINDLSNADAKEATAARYREHARLLDILEAARARVVEVSPPLPTPEDLLGDEKALEARVAAYRAANTGENSKFEQDVAKMRFDEAKANIRAFRQEWRSDRTTHGVGTVDNFAEPSDDELTEMGYN